MPPSDTAPSSTRSRRAEAVFLLLLLVFSWTLRGWRLSQPDEVYFDEEHYVPAALMDLYGLPETNTNAPPVGKLLIAGSIRSWLFLERLVYGSHDYTATCLTWRAGSCLCGLMMIVLLFYLGKSMFGRSVACAASFLLSIDFLHIVSSRIATLDIYLSFFVLFAMFCVWEYMESPAGEDLPWLMTGSVALGLGTATKWSCLFFAAGAFPVVVMLKQSWQGLERGQRCNRTVVVFCISLSIIALLYLISFFPRLRSHGYDVGATVASMRRSTSRMISFRYSDHFLHAYLSPWWKWPTLLRPCWYYLRAYDKGSPQDPAFDVSSTVSGQRPTDDHVVTVANGKVQGILAIGSPWVWWSFLPMLAATLWHLIRCSRPLAREERALTLIVVTYLSQLLLWSINKGFMYYMLPLTPLMALLVGWMLSRWCRTLAGRYAAAAWMVMSMACLMAFWPLLVAWPIGVVWYSRLIWLPRQWL